MAGAHAHRDPSALGGFLLLVATCAAWAGSAGGQAGVGDGRKAPCHTTIAAATAVIHAIGQSYTGSAHTAIVLGSAAERPDRSVLMVGAAVPGVDLGSGAHARGDEYLRAFVALYAPDGTPVFVHRAAEGESGARTLLLDRRGTAYVAGWYRGRFELGGHELESRGERDAWLLALNTQGQVLWLRSFGGPLDDDIEALALGPLGDLVVATEYYERARFASAEELGAGFRAMALLKVSAAGAMVWQRPFHTGTSTVLVAPRLAVDPRGRILLAGNLREPLDLGGGPLATGLTRPGPCGRRPAPQLSPQCPEVVGASFVALFSDAGTHLWSRIVAGSEQLAQYPGHISAAQHAGGNRWRLVMHEVVPDRAAAASHAPEAPAFTMRRRELTVGLRGRVLHRGRAVLLPKVASASVGSGATAFALSPYVEAEGGRAIFGWDARNRRLTLVQWAR